MDLRSSSSVELAGLRTGRQASRQVSPRALRRLGRRIDELVGNTPLLALDGFASEAPGVALFAKAEWFNPSGSVKARAAASIIADAEASGRLTPGKALLDASSGNTGVAYAMLAAAKGYRAVICVPKNASRQVIGSLQTYGAEVVLTDPLQGSDGAIREAQRLAAERPDRFVYVDQYNNPANWQAHYRTTAEEIWRQTDGRVTHFIAGVGTSGTFMGTTRRLKELAGPSLRAVAVQPDAAFHGLEGLKHMASSIVPGIYDPTEADQMMHVSTDAAYEAATRLAQRHGLFVGPSSGAAFAAGLRLAREIPDHPDQGTPAIVMIFPDSGDRYAQEGIYPPS